MNYPDLTPGVIFLSNIIEPELGTTIMIWLGWILAVIGLLKIIFYLIGECAPSVWDKVKSPSIKRFLTGKGNRIVFGLGGLLTLIFGLGSVGLALLIRRLHGLG